MMLLYYSTVCIIRNRHGNYNTTIVAAAAAVAVVVLTNIVRSVREKYNRGREFVNSRSCVISCRRIHAANTVVKTLGRVVIII